jgi:hypothetical protein
MISIIPLSGEFITDIIGVIRDLADDLKLLIILLCGISIGIMILQLVIEAIQQKKENERSE